MSAAARPAKSTARQLPATARLGTCHKMAWNAGADRQIVGQLEEDPDAMGGGGDTDLLGDLLGDVGTSSTPSASWTLRRWRWTGGCRGARRRRGRTRL